MTGHSNGEVTDIEVIIDVQILYNYDHSEWPVTCDTPGPYWMNEYGFWDCDICEKSEWFPYPNRNFTQYATKN